MNKMNGKNNQVGCHCEENFSSTKQSSTLVLNQCFNNVCTVGQKVEDCRVGVSHLLAMTRIGRSLEKIFKKIFRDDASFLFAEILGSKLSFCPRMTEKWRCPKMTFSVLTLAAILSFSIVSDSWADDCPSGKLSCGINCCYVIDDGEIQFSRIDESTTGTIGDDVFEHNNTITKAVEIPTWVTSVGESAFLETTAPSIHVPSSVTSVGKGAFYELQEVRLESNFSFDRDGKEPLYGVKSLVVGDNATFTTDDIMMMTTKGYNSNFGVTSLTLGNGITGDVAVLAGVINKSNLTDVSIGNGITGTIPEDAFGGAPNLTSVVIGNGVTGIGVHAFGDNYNLTSVVIGDGVTAIGDIAFAGCLNLTSVTLGENVETIGTNAFTDNANLTSIELPDSLNAIGAFAFAGTGLTSIIIPDSVEEIGDGAFAGCPLTSITASDEMIRNIFSPVCSGAPGHETCVGPDLSNLHTLNCTDKETDGICSDICGKFEDITCNISSTCETGYFRSKGKCIAKPEGCTTMYFGECHGCSDGYEQFKDTCVPVTPPFSEADCYNNGKVPYNNECVDEYPFAKKHFTPAEAAKWLKDDDNEITITFKK